MADLNHCASSSSKEADSGSLNNPNNDWVVESGPVDSIQAIRWSPTSNILASVSWDCTVRAHQIDVPSASTSAVAEFKSETPPLDVCWASNGSKIVSAGCDKVIKIWDSTQSVPSVVGFHEKPIRKIACCTEGSVGGNISEQIVSGGWDKELRFWDPKQSMAFRPHCTSSPPPHQKQLRPVSSVSCSERVYAMDLQFPLLSVCLANKKVLIFDVRSPSQPMKEMVTLLKHQLRCISLAPDGQNCFAVGSVEGRCAVHPFLEDSDRKEKGFAFKCHRHRENVFAVNALEFGSGSLLASAGGDGVIYFWDKDRKQKLKGFQKMDLPVTDVAFNRDGSFFAYSVSYDWSKGIEHFQPKQQSPRILIHKMEPNEIRPKTD